jgi:hypothetical protein
MPFFKTVDNVSLFYGSSVKFVTEFWLRKFSKYMI